MTADSDGRTSRRLVIACAGVVATHAAVVLFGWWQQWRLFTQPPAGFIPMAPTTAAAFLLLATALLIQTPLNSPRRRWAARGVAGLALLLAAFALAARLAGWTLDPDAAVRVTTATLGGVPLGVMSPVTAAGVLLLALALLLQSVEHPALRAAVAPIATVPALAGTVVALGYAYGTPLLYGSTTIPVALPTGLSLLLVGVAVIAMAGPQAWPLRHLQGETARARLLRAFLPATILIVVVTGLIETRLGTIVGSDRVLFSAWLAVLAAAAVALLVGRITRRIGGALATRALAPTDPGEQRIESSIVDLTERTPRAQRLGQSHKMDTLGSLAGGAAHDFNSVLTALLGYADLVLLDLAPDSPHRKD